MRPQAGATLSRFKGATVRLSSSSSSSRSEGHAGGFDSPSPARCSGGRESDLQNTASLPGLVSEVHRRLLITFFFSFLALPGFLSQLLLRQQGGQGVRRRGDGLMLITSVGWCSGASGTGRCCDGRCCLCRRWSRLHNGDACPPTRPPTCQPPGQSTCGGELQIPLHEGLPLLLE